MGVEVPAQTSIPTYGKSLRIQREAFGSNQHYSDRQFVEEQIANMREMPESADAFGQVERESALPRFFEIVTKGGACTLLRMLFPDDVHRVDT